MLVEDKYFFQDKNYLLKTVQAFSKESLIKQWLEIAFDAYNRQNNPMGLEDDFVITLRKKIKHGGAILDQAFDILAAIYRFKYSDNQLAFSWDGRTHMEIYDEEWRAKFLQWAEALSFRKDIQRAILKYSLAESEVAINTDFLRNSLRRGLLNYFGLRIRSHNLYRVSVSA